MNFHWMFDGFWVEVERKEIDFMWVFPIETCFQPLYIYIYIYILEWTRNKIVAEFCWTCGLMDLSCMFRHQVRATIFVELVD